MGIEVVAHCLTKLLKIRNVGCTLSSGDFSFIGKYKLYLYTYYNTYAPYFLEEISILLAHIDDYRHDLYCFKQYKCIVFCQRLGIKW